ncbi:hypothetical protein [Acinetobacter courvalinii]|uniref:hypothetical protein n=1 Tax=Acinetobacter courvalinii TaxID=280147 RepID=UPI00289FB142|nr:hypothetical protein [Acinetobacter courvalinii]
MLSAANINHGLMLVMVMLISILLLIGAGIAAFCRMKSKNSSETEGMIILMVALLSIAGLLFSCAG